MKEKKFNYIYITTNLINGKQYIGDHSTNNLDDGYLGSGRPYFKRAKEKYGKENFSKEILEFFDTKQEAFDAQGKYIKKYKTLITENGYNISPTGGLNVKGCHSEETKRKIGKANKGNKISSEAKKKMSEFQKNRKRKPHSEETKRKIGKANSKSLKGFKHSNETKKKMSLRMKKFHKEIGFSENTKQKIGNAQKGKVVSKETIEKRLEKMKGYAHSEKTKQKISKKTKGENNPSAKLTNNQVIEIKTMIKNGDKIKNIASMYNVSIHTIYKYKYQIINQK